MNFEKITIKKASVVFMIAILGLFLYTSCEDEDKDIFDSFEKGGFVRFEDPFPTVVDIGDVSEIPDVSISATLEAPDNNVVSYTMEVSASISGSDLGPVAFGSEITSFPTTIDITTVAIASALGVDITTIGFGDTFTFKGTATNDKGVVYSSDRLGFTTSTQTPRGSNTTNDLLDELGYRNALGFGFAIPCPPETGDFEGDWVFEMIDLFGDGWDGAFVTVSIDGVATNYTVDDGDGQDHTVTIPAGTQNLVISYTPGNFEEEHVYTVTKPDGTVLGPFGPNPPLCIN